MTVRRALLEELEQTAQRYRAFKECIWKALGAAPGSDSKIDKSRAAEIIASEFDAIMLAVEKRLDAGDER